jgi:transposase
MLGALTLDDGITAIGTVEGATSGDVFTWFVNELLVPTLRPGQVVVLDNLGAHKVAAAQAAIEAAGARLLFQPPYHPQLNPIEETWSKVKAILRSLEARTIEALDKAIADACDRVSVADAAGWFRHAGYQITR